ncbi:MAG: cupredoxin domain-containing protein [Acidimicrobiales bacterium]
MTNRFTASLVVCVAAAGVAVGALALESDDTPTPAGGTPTTAAPNTGGYGAANDAGAVADGDQAAGATLQIRDFSFAAASVAPGGQVTVANGDGASHTVTADGGEFDSGEVPGGGTSTFQAPSQPGSYGFVCEIHPDMSGTLTVG